MADYTVQVDLQPHKLGDRWIGIGSIGPVLIDGLQPTNALTRIRASFRMAGRESFTLDSNPGGDAPIVIDDEDTWEATVPEIEEFLPSAGNWDWDMEFYEAGKTRPLTFYKGVLEVIDDVTK